MKETVPVNVLLPVAIYAAIRGGHKILDVYYSGNYNIQQKKDNSPITLADRLSHSIITSSLEKTNLPVLSEEGKEIPYIERKKWDLFWLVDPLDGTKEFVSRNGEFTVNIALIHERKPLIGVIYVPDKKILYFGVENIGSYKVYSGALNKFPDNINGWLNLGRKLPIMKKKEYLRIVGSRSHMNTETKHFIEEIKKKYKKVELVSKGSSLKLCMVAEGLADLYPRLAPTMEWDTAAGHAIARFAGCSVMVYGKNRPLEYNKKNLLNPWFIVYSGYYNDFQSRSSRI
jgi:3'(2'), 5'-bisphosphate nucleotidase